MLKKPVLQLEQHLAPFFLVLRPMKRPSKKPSFAHTRCYFVARRFFFSINTISKEREPHFLCKDGGAANFAQLSINLLCSSQSRVGCVVFLIIKIYDENNYSNFLLITPEILMIVHSPMEQSFTMVQVIIFTRNFAYYEDILWQPHQGELFNIAICTTKASTSTQKTLNYTFLTTF